MPAAPPTRYRSSDEDSGRWLGFDHREGDIVVSTRSKSGTTWVQMICALLVFQTADLPAPLGLLSPWLDWRVAPRDEVWAQLAGQRHRRIIKTHTPLDGLPLDRRATYVVVGRHPLDMAVSLYHQGDNIDRRRLRELTGASAASGPSSPRPPVRDWLLWWIEWMPSPREHLDSLPGILWHLSDAWGRRGDGNVVLVHYDDLLHDLEGEMRRLAERLWIDVADERWPELVGAARFDRMRASADQLAPDTLGVLLDRRRFFRQGSSGAARELLSDEELARYRAQASALAPPDLLDWLHRDPGDG